MKKRVVISLLTLATIITVFVSCSTNEKSIDNTKNIVEKGKEMITGDETTGKTVKNYSDNKKVSDYNLENFKLDMESKNYRVEIIAKDKDFFDAPKFEVEIGEDKVSAYDYEELSTLEKDTSAITEKGLVINGTKSSWNKTPHYYKKGELLIIYDGDDIKIINSLYEILGSELYNT
ncbi:hypothetical protein [Clostridium gasigenes]|uniref:Lipoprotein n=1 Tax=Clostridium gasigenes TaxID=94869 RepID=A0A1H0NDJ3_9CLOT|nr:hypothetical protein [Clostridium gasigenes]MBU3087472.1 hypothetical protein [Clostridium gasigenes]SDO90703.1 hypothetical protein SAMN04488529_101793 [Clostridium gasigenes]